MTSNRIIQALCFCAVLTACHDPMAAGMSAFDEARYPEAATQLRSVSGPSLSQQDRTRYSLYSGLAELALGNLKHAVAHLGRARCQLAEAPESLNPDERGRLAAAWRSMGRMPGQPLVAGQGCR